MNILIGILTIAFSLYIYIVNRPRSVDAKRILALLIVSGTVLIFGNISFSTPLYAFLSVISILSVVLMLVSFYGQICYEEAHKPHRCNRQRAAKLHCYNTPHEENATNRAA